MRAIAFQSKVLEIERAVRSDEIIRGRQREKERVRSLARNGERGKTAKNDEETLLGEREFYTMSLHV